jgi:hypothetical protein
MVYSEIIKETNAYACWFRDRSFEPWEDWIGQVAAGA